ncbi:hypothetical protein PENNAL_c0016G09600 [Penicillium nalgiovense]|uniref:Uncharacterized protein n=1 Tax=Penicillium nalgiovense TaxID=60175 RepID=A0A1V6YMC0_PENNA|nr:hypothetical protein PENNAL_c0016G09600 [Penicillium nalgiovense]
MECEGGWERETHFTWTKRNSGPD